VLAALGARRIDVTWFGKAGTFGLMIAFPLFLASHSDLWWADTAGVLAWLAGIPALALSLYAAVLYVPIARRALREGRAVPSGT
jgi:cardiolipin synthase